MEEQLINIDTEMTTNEPALSTKMAQALSNSLFPALDSSLRSGKHISMDDLDNHSFLNAFQHELEQFYFRYHVELIRSPEAFYYLRPRSTTLIPRSVLSEIEMLVGKVLCYLYLSPERLAQEGIFTLQDLYDELLSLADENRLIKLVNQRSTGTDLDKQKLFDKVKTALNRLRRLGMVYFYENSETIKFRITEAIFRFGADVRSNDDLKAAQLNLIKYGEAVVFNPEQKVGNLTLNNESVLDTDEVNEPETDSSLEDTE